MIARRQTGAWIWTWTLPPAQQVVKVLSAPKWINCVEFEFFLGQLKMQKSSSTVSGFQPLSPQDDFDAWTESAIIFVWHCFSKRYQFNLLCLYPSRISSLVRIQFCVRNIAQGRPCRAKKKTVSLQTIFWYLGQCKIFWQTWPNSKRSVSSEAILQKLNLCAPGQHVLTAGSTPSAQK